MIVRRFSFARFSAPFVLASVLGCAGSQHIPADHVTTIVSLQKIDCADCGQRVVRDVKARPGVYAATFDKKKAEVSVVAARTFDTYGVVRGLAEKEGFTATAGAGAGSYAPPAAFPEQADVKTVAKNGNDVPDLRPVLVGGKVTVIDFSAVWCEPCRKLDEHMVSVLATHGDVAYRKLDIGDWDTPLAERYLKGVPNLPYVMVFDKSGRKIDAVSGLDLGKLDAAIARGAR
jgi:thiol-disulfide isomerase/thioredoxin